MRTSNTSEIRRESIRLSFKSAALRNGELDLEYVQICCKKFSTKISSRIDFDTNTKYLFYRCIVIFFSPSNKTPSSLSL